jgi:hypothetical protein
VLLLSGDEHSGPDKGEVRKLVFERLNTGGQHLNAQELRNCLYSGEFNDLLIKLARAPLFTKAWRIPSYEDHVDKQGNADESLRKNQLYRRMVDCELVLRFFAFRKKANVRGSTRAMLDRFMKENMNAGAAELTAFSDDFNSRLKLAHEIFGAHTFQYEDEKGEWQSSYPLYDGVMVALDRLWEKRTKLIAAKAKVAANLAKLLKNQGDFETIIGKPNTSKAVLKRMDLITSAMDSAL